jgi:hypothetical protein
MSTILPNLPDVISGIITLGANGGEQLFLPKIHTVLYQMKQHNSMLANLWFSIRQYRKLLKTSRKFYALHRA